MEIRSRVGLVTLQDVAALLGIKFKTLENIKQKHRDLFVPVGRRGSRTLLYDKAQCLKAYRKYKAAYIDPRKRIVDLQNIHYGHYEVNKKFDVLQANNATICEVKF